MGNVQYIGARYVPILFTNPDDNSADWKSGVTYEALTIVTYNDDSYTSKKAVPDNIGDPASNPAYWVKTGNFNASLITLQNVVSQLGLTVDAIKQDVIGVYPEFFGAYGDGVHNDTQALQDAIDYCEANDVKLMSTQGRIYKVDQPLIMTTAKCFFNGAKIVNISGDYVIKTNPTDDQTTIATHPSDPHILGLTVDCKNGYGISIKAVQGLVRDCKFINIGETAIINLVGYETIIENCVFIGNGAATSIGVRVEVADGHYTDLVGRDLNCALYVASFGVFTRCHFWISDAAYYSGSRFAHINTNSRPKFAECDIDTYSIAFDMHYNVAPRVDVSQCNIHFLTSVVNGVTSYLFYMPSIGSFRTSMDVGLFVDTVVTAPTGATYYLNNLYDNGNWMFPLYTKNCVIPGRNHDFVDLTNYVTAGNILAGSIKIKYGEALYISIRVKVEAGTQDIFQIYGANSGGSWISCFAVDPISIPVIYGASEWSETDCRMGFLLTADANERLILNLGNNVASDTYVTVNAVVPLNPAVTN